jgi:hypothetical protein
MTVTQFDFMLTILAAVVTLLWLYLFMFRQNSNSKNLTCTEWRNRMDELEITPKRKAKKE